MRYTANARMVSWDFATDAAVRNLSDRDALTLVLMICRADNLGRLPGEPDVLLSHLFTPKRPREGFTPETIRACLEALAESGIIQWYSVDGTNYCQLVRWTGHQKIREDLRKSDLPEPSQGVAVQGSRLPPDKVATSSRLPPDKGALEVEVEVEGEEEGEDRIYSPLATLGDCAVSIETEKNLEPLEASFSRNDTLRSGGGIGTGVGPGATEGAAVPPPSAQDARIEPETARAGTNGGEHDCGATSGAKYDPERRQGPSERFAEKVRADFANHPRTIRVRAIQLAGRLQRRGIGHPAVLAGLLAHYAEHWSAIRNPFAYYAPGSEGFAILTARVSAERAIAEHEALKRATEDWLMNLGPDRGADMGACGEAVSPGP